MASEDYDQKEEECNIAWLLREVRQFINEIGSNVSVYYAQHEAIKKFYAYYQNKEDSIATYLQNLKTMVAVVEHYGGDIIHEESLVNHEKENNKKMGCHTRATKNINNW